MDQRPGTSRSCTRPRTPTLGPDGRTVDRPPPPQPGQHLEHFYLTLRAAAAGIGVAIASEAMVLDDLASGTLVAPFGFVADGTRYLILSDRPLESQRP
jgi:DNA-binding transcriptional LysR family regulator